MKLTLPGNIDAKISESSSSRPSAWTSRGGLSAEHASREIHFGTLAQASKEYGEVSPGQLFHYLLNVDEHLAVLPIALDYVNHTLSVATPDSLEIRGDLNLQSPAIDSSVVRVTAIAERQQMGATRLLSIDALGSAARDACADTLMQYAPAALVDACWLQNSSNAANSHTTEATKLLGLYAQEIGEGDLLRHHGALYRELLRSMQLDLPEASSPAFVRTERLSTTSFLIPAFHLAVSQFPSTFFPEILGVTLHYYSCGGYPLMAALRPALESFGIVNDFARIHDPSADHTGQLQTILEIIQHYLTDAVTGVGAEGADVLHTRLWTAFATMLSLHEELTREVTRLIDTGRETPTRRMVALIRRKAKHSRGYHKKHKIGDRLLDEWLDPARSNVEQFLNEFAASKYVIPGDSRGSDLMKRVVSFGGPMFRVFSEEELSVIAEWIDSLSPRVTTGLSESLDSLAGKARDGCPTGLTPARTTRAAVHPGTSPYKYERRSLREIYYCLLNVEKCPEVLPFVKGFVEKWLKRSSKGLRNGKLPLPFYPYSHSALEDWVDSQHARQVAAYKPIAGKPAQSKQSLVDATIQQAPTTLIDGAWVQNIANASTSGTRVGSLLFRIYYDEVGNGDRAMNHPNVFRELLAEMGVTVPELGSRAFCDWSRFRDTAFELPIFWLSISHFPRRFRAELLGLNLAIEFAGVGGGYMRACDTLRYYGFNPLFCELHNTIDNVSTGHTAVAVDAIRAHMDEASACGGDDLMNEHWERMWTGFRASVPAAGLWTRILDRIAPN